MARAEISLPLIAALLVAKTATAQVPTATPTDEESVQVHGTFRASPRGLGDIRIDREQLTDSPRQQTSEMLSAAPGFFVDHEDGEGLGNDVYLRGFDLDSGSGIEMKVGQVPINVPLHIHGQGYADVNFIIPEVVRSVRVLEGPYDPRQGDAAIVGSATFDLGVLERGYQLKTTLGSFGQARVVGILAPRGTSEETFLAFSLRETPGFGQDRASQSASVNAQYGVDVGTRDHLRVIATAYAAKGALPGVVRQDDVNAGRIDYYGAYSAFNSYFPAGCKSASCAQPAQGVQAARVIVGAELDHPTAGGARVEVAPWVMWTDFRARQNFTGNIDSSNQQPQLGNLGDLWQTTNRETAAGATSRIRSAPVRVGSFFEAVLEPGVSMRAGHTDQAKSLLDPANLATWDDRASFGLDSLDLAGYLDLDVKLWKKLRISGGARADYLAVLVKDNLAGVVPNVAPGAAAGSLTDVAGVAPGPRVTVGYEIVPELTPVVSAGEGFRSLDAGSFGQGSPYSQVTSVEGGLRSDVARGRFTTTFAVFQTNVANELVFEAAAGGLTTENASVRRGFVGSFVAKPWRWLLASTALSLQSATFDTLVTGGSHYVSNVPAVLWRSDVNAHGELLRVHEAPLTARAGLGFTLLGGRHVTDTILARTNDVLNALVSVRYTFVELGCDAYNIVGLKYADDQEYYVSNWSTRSGAAPASHGLHVTAAPPRTVLGTLSLYF